MPDPRSRPRAWRRVLLGLIAALALIPPSTVAAAGNVRFLQPISSFSPFGANGCGVVGLRTPNSEGEPSVAVNPRDPNNVIAVWQQDRFTVDGGALSNIVGVSKNGGRTWRRILVPGISRCTGGTDERTSDPWISIGPDGTAYLATLTFTEHPDLVGLAGPTSMLASRSTDGGITWSRPVTVVNANVYDDRESVTADPRLPGHAYYVWVRRLGVVGAEGTEIFSRTTNGGRTWSAPRQITKLRSGTLPDPALIEALPNGTLVNLYLLANASPFLPPSAPRTPWEVMVQRSTNQGTSWSAPRRIARIFPPSAPSDPDTGAIVRAYNLISADVGPDGSVYVAWNVIRSERSSQILFSRSRNSGRSWTAPRALTTVRTQAFLPSLAVAGNGTLGVTWDDLRNDRPGDGRLTTDVWLARSRDRGASWRETHVAGPFNTLTAAPTDSTGIAGRFLGDFQGLAGFPRGLAAVFAQGRPQTTHGGTDIFFTRLAAGATRRRSRFTG
jgi:BNR repeat-like domain